MSYTQTFIHVAEDCPVTSAVIPAAIGSKRSLHLLQYELLSIAPYTYTHGDLLFEVYVRYQGIPQHEVEARGTEIRAELL